jgi:diguanylate cyclase (GGDEF)-like protein
LVGRKRICLLGAPLNSFYSSEFWRGAADSARDEDLDFIYAVGGLQVSYFERVAPAFSPSELRSTLGYQLVDPATVDGIVVWGAQWAHDVDGDTIRSVLSRFQPLPIVSVGFGQPGIRCVRVDNYSGVRELVSHLIEVHGYKKIAFLKSASALAQPEAEARFAAYHDSLAEHGIEYRPELVVLGSDIPKDAGQQTSDGTYSVRWASLGIETLIDRRGLRPGKDFQALIGRDDNAALTAMDELAARGWRIPRDVAVCGFDDVTDGRCGLVPLTTVHQSFSRQGAEAVRIMAGILRGEEVPAETVLDTARLVIRESCGCPNHFMRGASESAKGALSTHRLARLAASMKSIPHEAAMGYARELWQAALKLHSSPSKTAAFTDAVQRIALDMHGRGLDVMEAAALLSRIKAEIAASGGKTGKAMEKILEETTILVGDIAQRFQLKMRLAGEYSQARLEIIGQSIMRSFELDQTLDTFEQQLPELGIPGCSIALYKDPQKPLSTSYLCFSLSGGRRRQELRYPGLEFPSRALLPAGYWPQERSPRSLILWPVFFAEKRIGFLVFERGNPQGRPYFNIATHIGSVLQGALLVNALSEKKLELEKAYREILDLSNRDALTGLYNRRAFQQELVTEKRRADRYSDKERSAYSLLFLDLDNFKYYNDSFGHSVGDAALKAFAELLMRCIRSTDTVARFGGDEFVVLMPEAGTGGAEILADRILGNLRDSGHLTKRIEELSGSKISVPPEMLLDCSIGISRYNFEADPEGILKRADKALLQAKSEGKGRYRISRPSESSP